MQYGEFVDAVLEGDFDHHLSDAIETLVQRRKYVERSRATMWAPGMRVRVTTRIKPKYVAGLTGTIRSRMGDRVWVEIDQPLLDPRVRRYLRPDGTVGLPATSLEAE